MFRSRGLIYASSIFVLATAMPLVAQPPNSVFNPLPPCRVVDSRSDLGTTGALLPGQIRNIIFRGQCGIPGLTTDGGRESNVAVAIAVNVVAANPVGAGHLSAWPSNQLQPASSILNYSATNIANGVILPMCDQLEVDPDTPCPGGDIRFQAAVSSTDLVIDVTGYYVKPTLSGAKRHGACQPFGGPVISYGLSDKLATFATAHLACPAGTQICPESVIRRGRCDTNRADSACDIRLCNGTCVDDPPDHHFGWADSENPFQDLAPIVGERDGFSTLSATCEYRPVWCCSTPG